MSVIKRLMVVGFMFVVVASVNTVWADVEQEYEEAAKAFSRGDVVTGMVVFRRLSEQGHVPSMLKMAYILDKAEFDVEAVEMYQRAAELGSAEAAHELGSMYATGEGVDESNDKAVEWYTTAASKGYGPAMVVLGRAYIEGRLGLAPNRETGMDWLKRSADKGFEPAKQELERLSSKQ